MPPTKTRKTRRTGSSNSEVHSPASSENPSDSHFAPDEESASSKNDELFERIRAQVAATKYAASWQVLSNYFDTQD